MLSLAARRLTLSGLCTAILALSCCGVANAEDHLLGFRMRAFKSMHMHDAAAAEKFIETLKTLRCEVKVSQHGDHKDVAFRTQQWKVLPLKSAEQLNSWKKWLASNGFETLRSSPVAKAAAGSGSKSGSGTKAAVHQEVVQYRAVETKTLHIHDPVGASEALAIYQTLGCKAEKVAHGGHSDLQVSCPEWREIVLPNHETAGSWETYLKNAGFETKHEHRH